jgi:N-acetyl-alpha-D-glucosaminyl L-malate synthase BshA
VRIGITCYPTYGGSGAVATELGIQLAARGHEVHFISYAQPFRLGHFRERIYFHEVEMEQYPLFEHPPYSLALAVALHETTRKEELDILHMHYAIPHATSAWIAQEMLAGEREVPVATSLHGTDITLVGLHPSFHAITRFSILKSQGLTTPSRFLKEETVRDFGVPADTIDVIPNFVDGEMYRPDKEPCHRATLAPEGERILMHVSNFRPVKRVVDVVEVFYRVRKELPARLVLVGDGPDRPRAMERVEELGLQHHVTFLGKHASVDELLPCCDVFLLPSAKEAFGLAALEAMACGAPVVASRVGGIPEVVLHGEGGYLAPVGDVDEMARAAVHFLSDDGRLARAREAARAHALEHFSADKIVPLYERFYERVVAAGCETAGAPA